MSEHTKADEPKPKKRTVYVTKAFKKDLAKAKSHRKCDIKELRTVMETIEAMEALGANYLDHPLTGRYPDRKGGDTDCRECHTSNDWLLIYRFPDANSVQYIRTGTHAELFG